jgi:16S rRNA (cytosine1402-N4)-methyltransferase
MQSTGVDGSDTWEAVHQSVMRAEVIEALVYKPQPAYRSAAVGTTAAIYLDGTLGLGGHTEAILEAAQDGVVIGIDRDAEALARAEDSLSRYTGAPSAAGAQATAGRVILRKGAFADLQEIIAALEREAPLHFVTPPYEISGILFDLGISSFQLDTADRGFSFQRPGPLDMRMDRTQKETAADWVNGASLSVLADLIWEYGEERWARRIASAIVRYREAMGEILQSSTLEEIIWKATPARGRHGRIHPATRTFQALRIAVNDELGQLRAGLSAAISLLARGGRLVVISFHSLEDRCVKQAFREAAMHQGDKRFVNLYKKPVQAGPEECARNPRARSAKMRVLERAA